MKKLLLHACCAPCALMPYQYLKEKYEITLFFYNPNIHGEEEFIKRKDALIQFAKSDNIAHIVESEYLGFNAWVDTMPTLNYPKRCQFCYTPRLEESAKQAKELGFDAFATSLLYSKYQQHDVIIEQGRKFADMYGLYFDDTDFRPYWYDGIKLSKEKNLYRQKYCGCGLAEKEVE